MRAEWEKIFEIRFNSTNKWQLSIHKPPHGAPSSARVLLMKGAPEIVLTKCAFYLHNGATLPIDDDFKARFQSAYEALGSLGERVLGFCQSVMPVESYPPACDGAYDATAQNFPTVRCILSLCQL